MGFERKKRAAASMPNTNPDADSHFAYSTTLRRHHSDGAALSSPAEVSSLWARAMNVITGQRNDGYESIPPERNLERQGAESHDTASARFALCSVEDTIAHYRTSAESGLPYTAIAGLLATHGYNEFSVSTPTPLLLKFLQTIYESPLILLLCGSATVSAIMGNVDDAVSIAVAVGIVLTAIFNVHILANELVPGDIITISTGDRVPADIRIIEASSLTGETKARRKSSDTCGSKEISGGQVALADRICIGYMGTLVRNGRGRGVVIATGTETEFGVIFSMMQDVEERRTPLQLSMDELAKKLSIMSFAVIGIICLIGVLQQRSWLDMFTIGVSLAVAAIPEGLPIVTTRKAIVKKLHSVEALGSVSVICSDKTGTLTKNEQTVTAAYVVDELLPSTHITHIPRIKTLEICALCNNASMERNESGVYVGQATDVALLNVLDVFGVHVARGVRPAFRPGSYRFLPRIRVYYMKGSIDAVLDRCRFHYVSDGSTPAMDNNTRTAIVSKARESASRGLRVIAMAYGYNGNSSLAPSMSTSSSRAPSPTRDDNGEKRNLVFVGFLAMLDPPRKGVADSIGLLQAGGVKVVMITGDAEETALSIARELGLLVGRGGGSIGSLQELTARKQYCLTGKEIDTMSKSQLRERVGAVSVFARTTPRHKMSIVEAFQARGAVVAMTGDGVNDAPALKMADIGMSMGKSGTDVAKEAADVILVDDNFSTILPAVEEGKSIFHNIQNFLSFQLSTAAAALTLITLSTMLGLSNPLNAMQILFINILMDGPPSQSLGVDPVDPAIMRRPPRKKDAPIITRRLLYRVLFSASIIVIGTLFVYVFALSDDNMSRREQTMTFTCFVFLDLVSAVQNRGLGCGLFQNKMLVVTVSVSAISQLALVYVPLMQAVFQTAALSSRDLSVLLALAATSASLHELRRKYERRLNSEESFGHAVEEMA
ncbi:hypothetical protein BD779DRAFT_1611837 [Infundibulicybe gibba]|nr:hypothetical protein BD779DRAFT_1611837 [Infundibulicybe gibba]